jgi:hypothetical protein
VGDSKPRHASIDVNNIGHQAMQRVDLFGAGYCSPYLLNRDAGGKAIVSCLVVYLPVFLAGVIFGTLFRASAQPDVDFGSNVGGIVLGGLSEYFS